MKIKKMLSLLIAMMLVTVLFVGCDGGRTPAPAAETPAAEAPAAQAPATQAPAAQAPAAASGAKVAINPKTGQPIRIAMVAHAVNSFTVKFEVGAKAAAEALGVTVDFMAPTSIDVPAQVALMENALSAGYDGIAITILDQAACKPIVDKARGLGIPVVAFNVDDLPNITDGTTAQDAEAAGEVLAHDMFKRMGGVGKVQLISAIPSLQQLILRGEGFKKAAKEYPGIELVNNGELLDCTTDMNQAMAVVENAYTANPDITCFLATDYFGESIGMFIQAQNLEGKVYGGAFDITDGIMGFIKSGHMQSTMGQNPFLQGYYPIVSIALKLLNDMDPVDVDSKFVMCNTENVDEWIAKGGE